MALIRTQLLMMKKLWIRDLTEVTTYICLNFTFSENEVSVILNIYF